jgi:hypothetical protein
MSGYFLTACLFVVAMGFEVSFRRSWNLSRNSDLLGPAQRLAVRRRAFWPAGCGLICMLLGWMVFHFVQDKLVLSVTGSLMMLSASFFTGSFIGAMAGTVNRV